MRGMNGSSGASPERGYSGIPAQVGPPMGGGPGGNAAAPSLHSQAAAAAAGLGGPELKHHADFLSRLLAATPSYLSEMGNPPPGFFSDWLRRLVSKPGGTSQSSLLTFPGQPPEAENSGRSAAPSNPPDTQQVSSKRRKRSRLNDRHAEHPNLVTNYLSSQSFLSECRPGSVFFYIQLCHTDLVCSWLGKNEYEGFVCSLLVFQRYQ